MNQELLSIENSLRRYSFPFRQAYSTETDGSSGFDSIKPLFFVLLKALAESLSICFTYIQEFGWSTALHLIDSVDTDTSCLDSLLSRRNRIRSFPFNFQPFHYVPLAIFSSFYTRYVIDNNHLPMLPLAKKLGGMAWTKIPNLRLQTSSLMLLET